MEVEGVRLEDDHILDRYDWGMAVSRATHWSARREGEKQRNTSVEPTTKIEEFVCPPNISKTFAVRFMKLAHLPRIASTTIKLISKPILLPILSIL